MTGTVPLDSGNAAAFRAATFRGALLGFNDSAGVADFPPFGTDVFGLDADAVVVRNRTGVGVINLVSEGLATLSADGKGFGAFVFFGIVILIPVSIPD